MLVGAAWCVRALRPDLQSCCVSLRCGATTTKETPRGSSGDGHVVPTTAKSKVNKKKSKKKGPFRKRKRKLRILILMSDTGGGHRASAKAIAEALEKEFPKEFETEIYDIWTDVGRWPLNRFVQSYTYLGRRPMLWRGLWYLTASWPARGPIRTWHDAQHRWRFRKVFEDRDPDVVVSVHPLCQHVPLSALGGMVEEEVEEGGNKRALAVVKKKKKKIPFATVVTDLGSAHPMWFDSRADVVFVPNERVARLARFHGVRRSSVVEHGLPLRSDFEADPDKPGTGALFQRRQKQQWLRDLFPGSPSARLKRRQRLESLQDRRRSKSDPPRVLVVGGGDGVGGMKRIVLAAAAALRERQKPCVLTVVCGRNLLLKSQLEEALVGLRSPHVKVEVLGFVDDMHRKMADADVLLTKAGPGTISEAAALGLPVILTNFLPGQERGNCAFVTDNGFGALAKRPHKAARVLVDWLDHPDKLAAMSDKAFEAAKPGSTTLIARDIAQLAKQGHLVHEKKQNHHH